MAETVSELIVTRSVAVQYIYIYISSILTFSFSHIWHTNRNLMCEFRSIQSCSVLFGVIPFGVLGSECDCCHIVSLFLVAKGPSTRILKFD